MQVELQWAVIPVLAVVVIQWLIFVGLNLFWRKRDRIDWKLVASSSVLLIVWAVAFDVRSLFASGKQPVSAASVSAPVSVPRATCASLDEGMRTTQVRSRMGEPDEETNEEDTRGPGATKWTYRASRCSVHFFDDAVEFID